MGIFRFALASGDAKLVLRRASIACAAEMAPTSESRRCSWWENLESYWNTLKTTNTGVWREMLLPDEAEQFSCWQTALDYG
jgi:hypothetical protein